MRRRPCACGRADDLNTCKYHRHQRPRCTRGRPGAARHARPSPDRRSPSTARTACRDRGPLALRSRLPEPAQSQRRRWTPSPLTATTPILLLWRRPGREGFRRCRLERLEPSSAQVVAEVLEERGRDPVQPFGVFRRAGLGVCGDRDYDAARRVGEPHRRLGAAVTKRVARRVLASELHLAHEEAEAPVASDLLDEVEEADSPPLFQQTSRGRQEQRRLASDGAAPVVEQHAKHHADLARGAPQVAARNARADFSCGGARVRSVDQLAAAGVRVPRDPVELGDAPIPRVAAIRGPGHANVAVDHAKRQEDLVARVPIERLPRDPPDNLAENEPGRRRVVARLLAGHPAGVELAGADRSDG
eukprot:5092369-Prymnesium_polylepis.2